MDKNTEAVTEDRERISVALKTYPDVVRMRNRHRMDYPGTTMTHTVISALREYYIKRGYARKKDLAK